MWGPSVAVPPSAVTRWPPSSRSFPPHPQPSNKGQVRIFSCSLRQITPTDHDDKSEPASYRSPNCQTRAETYCMSRSPQVNGSPEHDLTRLICAVDSAVEWIEYESIARPCFSSWVRRRSFGRSRPPMDTHVLAVNQPHPEHIAKCTSSPLVKDIPDDISVRPVKEKLQPFSYSAVR